MYLCAIPGCWWSSVGPLEGASTRFSRFVITQKVTCPKLIAAYEVRLTLALKRAKDRLSCLDSL